MVSKVHNIDTDWTNLEVAAVILDSVANKGGGPRAPGVPPPGESDPGALPVHHPHTHLCGETGVSIRHCHSRKCGPCLMTIYTYWGRRKGGWVRSPVKDDVGVLGILDSDEG